jgi:hypothetical protein
MFREFVFSDTHTFVFGGCECDLVGDLSVIIEFRDTLGVTMLDEATGVCRFCGALWKGRHALRQLRWDIDRIENLA